MTRRFIIPPFLFLAAVAWLAFCLTLPAQDASRQFSTGPAPAWVAPSDPDLSPDRSGSETNDSRGEQVVLIDQQKNAETFQDYLHLTKRITSQNGVQNGARLEFDFDPAFQQLAIHFIFIIRDGHILNRLEPSKFKIIQQETGLDRHLFNGELSAVLFLEDVRVGDIIDYAYTLTGANPILDDHFISSFLINWTFPVHEQRCRLLWPSAQHLTIRNHLTNVPPAIKNIGPLTECLWTFTNSPPLTLEDSIPGAVESFGWIQFTDFSSWAEVAAWALPLFQPTNSTLPPDLLKKIAQWKTLSPERQIASALRFVQDEVRYLGIEIGPNSHQPNSPDVVFSRRFGDCKDKVALFCAILKELKIEAAPVLVHSYRGAALDQWAPSPYAFNHAVVRVKFKSRSLWLDPTLAYQRGSIGTIYFPDYARGLVIAPGTDRLIEIPAQSSDSTSSLMLETLRFFSYSKPATYEVRSIRRGAAADSVRSLLARTTRDGLQRAYLNHYAKRYPDIKIAIPMEIRDDEDKNEITIIQNYTVRNIWEPSEDKSKYSFTLFPDDIYDFAERPGTSFRTYPLAIEYPCHLRQKFTVIFPGPANFKESSFRENGKAVRFESKVSFTAPELTLDYSLDALTNIVSAAEVPGHLATLKTIRTKSLFNIQRPNSGSDKPSHVNWLILALAAVCFIAVIGGAFLAYHFRPRLTTPPPLDTDPNLTGIGGWLILTIISLFLRFFVGLVYLVRYSSVFSLEKWNLFTNSASATYDPNMAPLLLGELLWNIAAMVIVPLLLILLFQKRFAFPRYFIIFMLVHFVVTAIDTVCAGTLLNAAKTHHTAIVQIAGAAVSVTLWTAYFLKSRRVKFTFTR